jgi:hypothetical protein
MLHDKAFNQKPTTINAKSFSAVETSIDELISNIESGKTIRPGILKDNKSSDKDWMYQELVFIDVDDYNIEDSLNTCCELQIEPLFVYKSFNYTDTRQKHRLVFRLDTPLVDPLKAYEFIKAMTKAFKGDIKCCNLSRLFYGTNTKAFCINKESVINLDKVLDKLKDLGYAQTPLGFNEKSDANNEKETNDLSDTSCIRDPQLKNLLYILIPKGISCGSFSHINSIMNNRVFESYGEIAKAFKQLDLSLFVGGKSIKCILPGHEDDQNPSASIYKSDSGYYYYKCHACNNDPLDLYGLIALHHGFTGPNNYVFYKCTNVLIDTFKLRLSNTTWKKEQDRIIKANKIILKAFSSRSGKNDYLTKYPKASKEFLKRVPLLRSLTDEALIALEVCPTRSKKGELLFNTSLRYIANDIGKDFSSVGKWIKLLTFLGFIKKIDHNSIKNTKMGQLVVQYSKEKNFSKVAQIYSIPEWTEDVFKQAEENYKIFKENGGTLKGATARQFKALGNKKVVIQTNKETEAIKAIRDDITSYIRSNKKYCLVKDLKLYGKKQGYSDKLISSFISEIGKLDDIKYFRYATKDVKNKYELPDAIHHSNAIFVILRKEKSNDKH